MSWTFHLQNINRSFDSIALWLKEFMQRTELCFRALHERVSRLEAQPTVHGPTDEQVERVLRKILSERFSNPNATHPSGSSPIVDSDGYLKYLGMPIAPCPIEFDPVSLLVDPESVPSQAYAETFHMLQRRLADFPHIDSKHGSDEEDGKSKSNFEPKTPKNPPFPRKDMVYVADRFLATILNERDTEYKPVGSRSGSSFAPTLGFNGTLVQ